MPRVSCNHLYCHSATTNYLLESGLIPETRTFNQRAVKRSNHVLPNEPACVFNANFSAQACEIFKN